MLPFRFHPEARDEARVAVTWYRERSREAARGFNVKVNDGIRSIRERPLAWPVWHASDVRRRVLRRFPYSIFYLVERGVVVIVAIAHHKQRPGYWLPRLGA